MAARSQCVGLDPDAGEQSVKRRSEQCVALVLQLLAQSPEVDTVLGRAIDHAPRFAIVRGEHLAHRSGSRECQQRRLRHRVHRIRRREFFDVERVGQ